MCVDLPAEMRTGLGRRRLIAGLGLGAAGLALTACTPSEASTAETAQRKFGPPPSSGSKTKLVLLGTAGGPTHFPGNDTSGIASALVVGDPESSTTGNQCHPNCGKAKTFPFPNDT